MSASIKVDASDLIDVMNNFAEVTGKSIPQLVRAHARLCAVELANRTQPFSAGANKSKARTTGVERVKNDIGKVIKTRSTLDDMIAKVRTDDIKARLKELLARGKYDAFTRVFSNIGFLKKWGELHFIKKGQFQDIHGKSRNARTGRTKNRASALFVANEKALASYANKIARRVGLSKSGWARCAEQIGGTKGRATRGIPGWVSRQKDASGTVKDNSRSKLNPNFVMTNNVPWLDRICPPGEQRKSLNIARDKMVKFMMRAMREATKKKAKLAAVVDSATSQ